MTPGKPLAEPKELGTLVIVVGKAIGRQRNLPNKSRFGKQDPFCTVRVGEDKQRTKAIKRGGQHPEWDEELRFTLIEDVEDVLSRSESQTDASLTSTASNPPVSSKDAPGVITAAALASKSRKPAKKGGKAMRVACYADDAKEPELIGECVVNVDEVLKKGEVDEWYEFQYKEKYSGEVYLELTFFSNDAPPVRRNVPRPSVQNYGGAGTFNPNPSFSSSSLSGPSRSSGHLSSSGSVSGMSLYIPPYVQQGRAPSPAPLAYSNSFAELGLPPGHMRKQSLPPPMPHQPGFPPAQPYLAADPVDALSRPMSSMSLSQSYSSRPLPPSTPTSQQQQSYANHNHRHSLGQKDAPWSAQLPQSQSVQATRPVSSNAAVPWAQIQRQQDERGRQAATPVPRPISQQSYSNVQSYQQPYQPSNDYRASSPLPASLQPAPPLALPQMPHSNSVSHLGPPQGPGYQSSPAPTPPPHSASAPPFSPTSGHYQMPASSFGGLAQNEVPPQSTTPTPYQNYGQNGQADDPYGGYPGSQTDQYQSQPPANHRNSYPGPDSATYRLPQYQPHPSYSNGYPPGPPTSSYPPAPPQSYVPAPSQSYTLPPQSYTPAPPQPSTPAPQTFPPPNQQSPHLYAYPAQNHPNDRTPSSSQGYVPWYQQTQPQAQLPPPPPPPPSSQTHSQAPPVPQAKPGHYPSDELYIQQTGTQVSAQNQWQEDPYRSTTPQPHRGSNGWNTTASQYGGSPPRPPPASHPHYDRAPSPLPHSQSMYGRSSSPQPPQPQYNRAPSPAPPQSYQRAPSPQPPHSYRAPSPLPQSQSYRAPSPQPPPQTNYYAPQPQSLNPPAPQTNGWQPPRSASPLPPARPSNQDWKDYMSNVGGSAQPLPHQVRAPSPQPPPPLQQQQWYTPPPSLPASIRPPEGWRSTLPSQGQAQQRDPSWRS
ncbi:hypothetical protein P7C73_g936, partial [Tremellales sp. Uapishka_1]